MPSPVEALPWGSRSTISTCSPVAASAVPRLIAVVVLPTPPFWLATASTRGSLGVTARLAGAPISARSAAGASVICVIDPNPSANLACFKDLRHKPAWFQGADHHDTRLGIGSAGHEISRHLPTFRCFGQFSLYILSLWKQSECPVFQQR